MEKYHFCEELCSLLMKTEQYEDLVALVYFQDVETKEETVTPVWWDPISMRRHAGKPINVTADSLVAIIKDVLKGLG